MKQPTTRPSEHACSPCWRTGPVGELGLGVPGKTQDIHKSPDVLHVLLVRLAPRADPSWAMPTDRTCCPGGFLPQVCVVRRLSSGNDARPLQTTSLFTLPGCDTEVTHGQRSQSRRQTGAWRRDDPSPETIGSKSSPSDIVRTAPPSQPLFLRGPSGFVRTLSLLRGASRALPSCLDGSTSHRGSPGNTEAEPRHRRLHGGKITGVEYDGTRRQSRGFGRICHLSQNSRAGPAGQVAMAGRREVTDSWQRPWCVCGRASRASPSCFGIRETKGAAWT